MSPVYFVVFVLVSQFVLVNVVVAVLMKHLEVPLPVTDFPLCVTDYSEASTFKRFKHSATVSGAYQLPYYGLIYETS